MTPDDARDYGIVDRVVASRNGNGVLIPRTATP
jgi:ATP-dependent protease ClpP protease subunit